MNLKKKEVVLAYGLLGVLGVFAVSRLVFVPFHKKLAGFDRDVVLKEARLRRGLTLVEKRDEIAREYAKYDAFFSLHNASSEEAVGAFLKEIEKVSRATGLVILDVKPQKEAEEDKSSRQYQISLKAEAGMAQLVKFLHALHNSSLLFSVEKLTLIPKGDNAFLLSVTMTLVGVVFK